MSKSTGLQFDFKLPPSYAGQPRMSKRGGVILPNDILPGSMPDHPIQAVAFAGKVSTFAVYKDIVDYAYELAKEQLSEQEAIMISKKVQSALMGKNKGGVSKSDVVKFAKKKVLPEALDVGVNIAAQGLSHAVLDPLGLAPVAPIVGKITGKIARKAIKGKTGYGCAKKSKGVGKYKGGANVVDKRKVRGEMIRKLMREKGMSFVEASKSASQYL